jgi:cyanate lyase
MLSRVALLEAVITAKITRGLTWSAIATAVGRHEVWTTSALLGQQAMAPDEAARAVAVLGLEPAQEATLLLCQCPSKGTLGMAVPTDPLIYRFYEILQVYGTTLKELIHEKCGDGIMSAIDYTMAIERKADPKGDRVVVTLDGKFLAYKKW